MPTWQTYLLVGLGGALGSVARFWLAAWVVAQHGKGFPLGTLLVNISGSFAIGFFATLTGSGGRWLAEPRQRDFFMSGICGGYTTFSAFSLQTLALAQEGQWYKAGANVVLSVVLCLAAVWLGHVLAASLNPGK